MPCWSFALLTRKTGIFIDLTAKLDEGYYFMLVGGGGESATPSTTCRICLTAASSRTRTSPQAAARGRRSTRGHSRSSAFTLRRSSGEGRCERGHCGSRAGCGKARLHQGHPRDRPHDRGFGGAVHQARLSRHFRTTAVRRARKNCLCFEKNLGINHENTCNRGPRAMKRRQPSSRTDENPVERGGHADRHRTRCTAALCRKSRLGGTWRRSCA